VKVIVGLGNPGSDYSGTRHNVGFRVTELLGQRWSIPLNRKLCRSRVGEGNYRAVPVRLVQPETFMNVSGEAVSELVQQWKLDPTDLLVIADDVALPLGSIRLRAQGSDGGHNGLGSILQMLGTEAVARLRVGIQPAALKGDLADYVLEPFSKKEQEPLEAVLETACDAAETWVCEGMTPAMNRFNQKAE
jgi:peptidyl-tRNA hydrolase, PTH1 family